MHPTTVFMGWRKTGMSNILLIFLNARRSRANNKREAKQSWAGELRKTERVVGGCGINDWLTKGKLVKYPQYPILLQWSCESLGTKKIASILCSNYFSLGQLAGHRQHTMVHHLIDPFETSPTFAARVSLLTGGNF